MTLQECLKALADDRQALKHSGLMPLSGLTPNELRGLATVWSEIAANRKADILEKLRGNSEDNLEADFNDIFQFCLIDDDPNVKEQAIEGLWECEDRGLISTFIK